MCCDGFATKVHQPGADPQGRTSKTLAITQYIVILLRHLVQVSGTVAVPQIAAAFLSVLLMCFELPARSFRSCSVYVGLFIYFLFVLSVTSHPGHDTSFLFLPFFLLLHCFLSLVVSLF